MVGADAELHAGLEQSSGVCVGRIEGIVALDGGPHDRTDDDGDLFFGQMIGNFPGVRRAGQDQFQIFFLGELDGFHDLPARVGFDHDGFFAREVRPH